MAVTWLDAGLGYDSSPHVDTTVQIYVTILSSPEPAGGGLTVPTGAGLGKGSARG